MKIAKKEQKTLLIVVGLLLVLAVYFLFYTNKLTEIEGLENEVRQLGNQVAVLEEYEANMDKYKKDTEEYYRQVDEMVSQFPAEIKEETSIMYGRELETQIGMQVSSITMAPSALLNSFGVGERQKHLYSSTVTINFAGDYSMVKDMVRNINNYHDRRNMTNISIQYDNNTGALVGTATMNLFGLAGKDKVYEKPNTGIVTHGTSNIFGQ